MQLVKFIAMNNSRSPDYANCNCNETTERNNIRELKMSLRWHLLESVRVLKLLLSPSAEYCISI